VARPEDRAARLAEIFKAGCQSRFALKEGTAGTFTALDRFLHDYLANFPEIRFESQISLLQFDVERDLFDCKTIYWRDGEHFSLSGERLFGKRLLSLIDE
jgi:hypothetical protein